MLHDCHAEGSEDVLGRFHGEIAVGPRRIQTLPRETRLIFSLPRSYYTDSMAEWFNDERVSVRPR